MTETENLLSQAQDIALRSFDAPSEGAVMEIFRELCAERDRSVWGADGRNGTTVH